MKILIISPYFPPYNAIGALRLGKFAKYLNSIGHDVRVISAETSELATTLPVEIPEENVYRIRNYSPDQFVSQELGKKINTGKSAEVGKKSVFSRFVSIFKYLYLNVFCIPDRFIGWLIPAWFGSKKVLKNWSPDLVYASAQPYSALLLGKWIAKKHDVPLVAEFRDLWSDNHYLDYPNWRAKLDRWLERSVCNEASLLVTVSEPLAQTLSAKYNTPCHVTYNGFDSVSPVNVDQIERATLDIVYTGFIYPGKRDPSPLFRVLKNLGSDAANIRVRFFGRRQEIVQELADKEGVSHLVSIEGEITHEQAVAEQAKASLLLLLLWDTPEERGVLTGKLFEYLASRRPILVLGCKDGLAAQLVDERGAGFVADSEENLEKQIRKWLAEHEAGAVKHVPETVVNGFSRTEQFESLTNRLENTSRRKNICVVTTKLDIGGTEQHLMQVLPRLNPAKFRTQIVTLYGGGALNNDFRTLRIPVSEPYSRIRALNILQTSLRLIVMMCRHRGSIFHFWLPGAYLVGGCCGVITRHKLMVMSRRSLNKYQDRHPYLRRLEIFLHRRMQVVLGNSSAIARELELEDIPSDKIKVIRNALDPDRLVSQNNPESVRRNLGVTDEAFVITCVANLIPYKGHADLFEAIALVVSKKPSLPLILLCVGSGSEYQIGLEEKAKELGISENVVFTGSRKDIADILVASDLGVLASHEEGSSNSVLEAMAVGLPVIATAVGGNIEIINHDETGLLVPAKDPQALSTAILQLLEDPEKRNKFGQASAEFVSSNYILSECVHRYEGVYSALAKSEEREFERH